MDKGNLAGIIVGCSIAIIGVVGIVASSGPPTSPEPESTSVHTLSVSVSPSGAGSVSNSGGEYESGAQVVLIASPTSGYTFDRWSGSASGSTPAVMITMDSDKSVTANFKATPTVPEVLFSDDFSDEGGVWDTYDAEHGSVFYENGWLHLINNNPAEFATGTWAQQHLTDFILEVETKLVAGTDENWHTIICRYQDNDNYYSFRTSADGYYSIDKSVGGSWIALASVTYSSYINQGEDAVNLIRIECIGSDLSLAVNGHLLKQVTDAAIADGDIVLGADALAGTFTEIAYDNIVVSEP